MVGVAREFLEQIERIAARIAIPRVRALHLPAPGLSGKEAEFCALELDDGAIGLSYVWLGDTLSGLRAGPPQVAGLDAFQVASWFAHDHPTRRTIGFAAINAISQFLFAQAGYVPDEAADSIGLLDPAAGEHIGMVGLFPPLIERVLSTGARLTVLELRTDLAGERSGYRVTLDPGELSGCDKIVCTSTVLLNDTLEQVLAAGRRARYFGIIGPTAGCLPDPLFARGVDILGGTRVLERNAFVAALQRGEPWGRHARKYCIRRRDYPGFDALLVRLDGDVGLKPAQAPPDD